MARYAARRSSAEGVSYVLGPDNRAGRYRFDSVDAGSDRLSAAAKNPFIWAADIVITIIVIIVLFWLYGSYWTNISANQAQSELKSEVDSVWAETGESVQATPGMVDPQVGDPWLSSITSTAEEGTPLMKMYAPRLGDDWSYTVVNGVTTEALRTGPGLYTSTQLPGQHGNVGIAGHRDGNGAPFIHLDDLEVCDALVLETRDNWFIYRVLPAAVDAADESGKQDRLDAISNCLDDHTASMVAGISQGIGAGGDGFDYSTVSGVHVTTPDDNSVIAPMPQDTTVPPEGAGLSVLTLTTCHPMYFNYERLITHAVLERVDAVDGDYVPAEIAGTAAGAAAAESR